MSSTFSERPAFAQPLSEGGWRLLVRVQPGARKTEILGEAEGRLRIRLAAPAVENKANKALLVLVAEKLGLRGSVVSLAAGETGRNKSLRIALEREPDWTRLA